MRDMSSGRLAGWHKFEAARRLAVIGLYGYGASATPANGSGVRRSRKKGSVHRRRHGGSCRHAALDSQRATAPGSRAEVSNTDYSPRTGGLTERTEACLVRDLLGGRPSTTPVAEQLQSLRICT